MTSNSPPPITTAIDGASVEVQQQYPRHFQSPDVSLERLAKSWQNCVMVNTLPETTIIKFDRWKRPVHFKPGQPTEICMVLDELESHLALCKPGRGFYPNGSPFAGRPFPPHPLRVISVEPLNAERSPP
jgi:hypothetical protein